MPRSVLITGGAGFIGCALVRQLLGLVDEVTVLDNLHPQVHADGGLPADLAPDVRFLGADVTCESNWATTLKLVRPDVVVHLAAETGTGQSLTEATRHGLVNVVGTTQLIDAFTRAGARPEHVVLASSRAVYGEGAWADANGTAFYPPPRSHAALEAGRWDPVAPGGGPAVALPSAAAVTEPRPSSVYAATKLAQEHVLAAWCAAGGTALSVLRLQNVYGPGQSLSNPYTGVLATFSRLAVERRAIPVYEDGAIWRDFVHVADVTTALCAAISSPPEGRRVVDIGSGTPLTIAAVAAALAEAAGAPAPVITGQYRDGDVRAASCSLEAARAELGYEPAWDFARGAQSLLAWVAPQVQP